MQLQDFSYDFGDVFIEAGPVRLAFRVLTEENVYGLDREKLSIDRDNGTIHVNCEGLVWAGGQMKSDGGAVIDIQMEGGEIQRFCRYCRTTAQTDREDLWPRQMERSL